MRQLGVGGTTPSIGVINAAIKLTREKSVDLCVIIRPRGGDFVYTDLEVEAMLTDIRAAKEIGVTCFVLGALTSDRKLDQRGHAALLAACGEAEVVFHMAFDELAHTDQLEAIEWLSDQGVARILTRAGSPGDPLEQRFAHYHRLLDAAKGKDSDPARWRCDPLTIVSTLFWSNWAFVNCMAHALCFKKKRSLLEVVFGSIIKVGDVVPSLF